MVGRHGPHAGESDVINTNVNEARNVVTVNRFRDMAVYDALPAALREELKTTSMNRACTELGQALVSGAPIGAVLGLVRAEERSLQQDYRRRIGL